MDPHQYTHIFVLGMIFAFGDAYGMGANDVANSFATSVSSGSLTLGQAVFIAIFTEFIGAFFLGAKTADTIRSKILHTNLFNARADLLMLGMTTSVAGSAAWVIFATRMGWPVSSTHSITGAVIGMGIAAFGGNAVVWGYKGVGKIVTSWFVSPVVAAIISAILFLITKYLVLERENSFEKGLKAIPFFVFLTFFINLTFIIVKGTPGSAGAKMSFGKACWISACAAAVIAAFSYVFYSAWLRRKIKNREDLKWYHIPLVPFLSERPKIPEISDIESGPEKSTGSVDLVETEEPEKSLFNKTKGLLMHGIKKDVRNLKNTELTDIHARAKKYNSDTEFLFTFIQVFSACSASFAHGSNDVANAVGPLASVYQIWQSGKVPSSGASVPSWIMAYCAFGIDVGLATYGYNIMKALGNNITYTTPSRGFAAELGTSLTVVVASQLGLPISTTHCITGAMAGVGLCNGDIRAINWKMYAYCFFSWVMTLPAAGLVSGLFFALVAYSPQK
ncbi:hypothetical protein BB559_006002 [Furculomyces boomerangus]|uniref:Phosphate transporter n=1 Tax=Furculomyces boomerangus TaxID=61424 RepID=A0A2T9Y5B0_9FUNG|nr:hypothetical protein BB559_006642 [Furculomyces boomerangus]PVU87508.1 hypothetical protein BB559_006002 [Furculomyces boomerangus]